MPATLHARVGPTSSCRARGMPLSAIHYNAGVTAIQLLGSKWIRLALALLYATALVWWTPRTNTATPVLLIALGWPLIFRLVPRNWLYGMRTPRTLWGSEETWYRQNVITGVVMVLIGAIWLGVLATR